MVSKTSSLGTVLHSQRNPVPLGALMCMVQLPGCGSLMIRHRIEDPDIMTKVPAS